MKQTYTQIGAVVLVIVACVIVYFEVHGSTAVAADANTRNYLDVSTNKPFKHLLMLGETTPILAPSGGKTGYPAELCYWTADGKPSDTPTSVVLNQATGKSGPTFCPVCHRLVVAMNPVAGPDMQPPPTEAEWKARHAVDLSAKGSK